MFVIYKQMCPSHRVETGTDELYEDAKHVSIYYAALVIVPPTSVVLFSFNFDEVACSLRIRVSEV